MEELLKKNLDILLPNVIADFHSQMIKFDGLEATHLANKSLRNLLVFNKEKHCLPFNLKIRFHYDLRDTIKLAGAMQFNIEESKNCILILNSLGFIEGMTKEARRYFELGENIDNYNNKFRKVNQVKK